MEIKILNLRPVDHKATRAFVDLEIDGITIRDFRVYQTNGRPSVRNPFATYKKDGRFTFREIVAFPSTAQAEINALVLAEYFRRMKRERNGRSNKSIS